MRVAEPGCVSCDRPPLEPTLQRLPARSLLPGTSDSSPVRAMTSEFISGQHSGASRQMNPSHCVASTTVLAITTCRQGRRSTKAMAAREWLGVGKVTVCFHRVAPSVRAERHRVSRWCPYTPAREAA